MQVVRPASLRIWVRRSDFQGLAPWRTCKRRGKGLSQNLHNLYILVVLDEGNQFQEWPAKIWGPVNHDGRLPRIVGTSLLKN